MPLSSIIILKKLAVSSTDIFISPFTCVYFTALSNTLKILSSVHFLSCGIILLLNSFKFNVILLLLALGVTLFTAFRIVFLYHYLLFMFIMLISNLDMFTKEFIKFSNLFIEALLVNKNSLASSSSNSSSISNVLYNFKDAKGVFN